MQHLYEKILLTYGYEVIAKASNGKEAIDIFDSLPEKPDLILIDHRMPVKNGIDATIEILKINSHIKIIFTSADNSIKKEALSIGATSFIEKPFSLERLHREIIEVLGSS